MGFYLRKSFKMGPMRLNLSKSGLGASFGVKGARIGLNSRGRAYVHAGRGGHYVRETLGSGRARSSAGHRRPAAPRPEPVVQYVRTGATYVAQPDRVEVPRLERGSRRTNTRLFLGALIAGVVVSFAVGGLLGWGLGAVLAATGAVLTFRAWKSNREADELRRRLGSFVQSGVWEEESWKEIAGLAPEERVPAEVRQREMENAFLQACRAVAEDGRIDDDELEFLSRLEAAIGASASFAEAARIDAFRGLYLSAVSDHQLDADEEAALAHVRDRLRIRPEQIPTEVELLDRLKELREIREGSVPVVEPFLPLQKSEVCHFEGIGPFLKEKQLRTYQEHGQRYKVRGLVVDKDGKLLVTSKRLLLVHTGTSSVRHEKILDLEVDVDENLIRITKDGASTPTLLTTPDAVRVGAIIASIAGSSPTD